MKVSEAFPSNYLKAADLNGRTVRAVINVVRGEDLGGDHKLVAYFEGKDRGLVLNKTNAATISMAYGDETDDWSGQPLELFPQMVSFQGQMVPSIRVRVPAQDAQADRIIPNTANKPRPQYSERNPPPPLDDDIPF